MDHAEAMLIEAAALRDPQEIILASLGVPHNYLATARSRMRFADEDLFTALRMLGLASSEKLAEAISKAEKLPYKTFAQIMANDFSSVATAKVPCNSPMTGVPLAVKDNTLELAVVNQNSAIDSAYLQFNVQRVIASTRSLQHVYRRIFAATEKAYRELAEEQTTWERSGKADKPTESEALLAGARVPKMFIALLRHASYMGASDMNFSKANDTGHIRIVIDGVGQTFDMPSWPTVERLIMCAVNSTDKNADQLAKEIFGDASFADEAVSQDLLDRELAELRKEFDYRLNFGNDKAGMTLTIRLLTRDSEAQEFNQLGFDQEDHKRLLATSRSSSGLVAVVGPTGSSKTTTLFSILNRIDPIERSVQTIENPVEYTHPLWLQYELRVVESEEEAAEQTLRGMLRNNPNVINVGEVRSAGTANTMMRAAGTGHLVFTTLHSDDATMAIHTMRKLEVSDEDIAANLQMVIAVRLARFLCPECKKPEQSEDAFEFLNSLAAETRQDIPKNDSIFSANAMGCSHCTKGYRGRFLLYELFECHAEVATAIRGGADVAKLRDIGIDPMSSLRGRGFRAVRNGKTSVDELIRVLPRQRF